MKDCGFAIRERMTEVKFTDLCAEITAPVRDLDRSCFIGFLVAAPDIQLSSPSPFSGVLI